MRETCWTASTFSLLYDDEEEEKGGFHPINPHSATRWTIWYPQWLLLPHHHENPTRGFLFHQLEINNTLGLFSLSPSFVPSGSLYPYLLLQFFSFVYSSPDRSSVRYVSRQHRVIGASMRPDEGLSPFAQQGGSNIGVL